MTEKEFTKFVNDTKSVVLGAVQKYLHAENVSSIDDVVQEIYLRAYKALSKKKFRSESSITTWLYTIAKNESFRFNDKMAKEREKVEEMTPQTPEPFKTDDGSWAQETTQYFKELIKNLPKKYREVIELDIMGYRDKQIAQMLNISAGTVKSRNSRARDMIRQLAAQDGYNG
ncbi:MAG: RNA polymerase sigma factor [Leptospirales bacterium]